MPGLRAEPRVRRPGPPLAVALSLVTYAAAVYLVVVVLTGRLLRLPPSGRLVLTVLAAAVVALTLEPVADRVRRRFGPTEQDRLHRLLDTTGSAEVGTRLAELARLTARSLGPDAVVGVSAELGGGVTASWHSPGDSPDGTPSAPGYRRDIVRNGRRVGALAVTTGSPRDLTPAERRRLEEAADLAGLAIAGARMDRTLRSLVRAGDERRAELESSRGRVLTAAEEERRNLERDIHDGAQQHLVALALRLRLLRVLLAKDPARAQATARTVGTALDEAVETLQGLSVGLYPAVLTDAGPGPALRAALAPGPAAVSLHLDVPRRWPAPVERAAYFSCLEAVQNAVKHAHAQRIVVSLTESADAGLQFAVTDDGRGFDPALTPSGSGTVNLADRVADVGGRLSVVSAPGRGTTVSGWLPGGAPRPAAKVG